MPQKNVWQNLLDKLSQSRYPYVIVGGAALALHGIPRSTLDIDIFIPPNYKSLEWIFNFCSSNKLTCKDPGIKDLLKHPEALIGQWLTFTAEEGIDIIDVFIESNKDFDHIHKNAQTIKTPKGSITIASIEDLLKLKKRSNRNIDKADIALINKWKSIH